MEELHAHEEIKKQIEEDADQEILEIKIKYERWLLEEKESNQQLKGEIGVVNKRVSLYFVIGSGLRVETYS